jgi:hypothetical protein
MVARACLALLACAVALAAAGTASASQLIDRDAKGIKLEVDARGQALLTYRAHGQLRHVLAWGAVNAIPSTESRPQVKLRLDYSGGWGTYRRKVWQAFRSSCAPYDGPALPWFVTGCKALDGSYWAIQSWQRMLPNYGVAPTSAGQRAWELRLSHWSGELPVLKIDVDWAYGRFDHLYGSLNYLGQPVFGFESTSRGNPLDSFGRNVYLDTFNSAYGPGWRRENSFLLHRNTGAFCYGFYPHGSRPAGNGERYRATVIGPGLTPDEYWEAAAPGTYDRQLDLAANEQLRGLGDGLCKPN